MVVSTQGEAEETTPAEEDQRRRPAADRRPCSLIEVVEPAHSTPRAA
ncbi:MAG: hypothetical protein MZV65_34855 [Chromatiales bacterium]|nr:hypothetical protein [Chromatiales bacterium]